MKRAVQKRLLSGDKELFSFGACHIFADELYKRLGPRGFSLRRLADVNRSIIDFEALHVYVGKDTMMVDVDGLQEEADFIRKMEAFRKNKPVPAFKVFECSRAELFAPVARDNDAEEGIVNRWNQIIEEDFVIECRKRANNLIGGSPMKYFPSVSNQLETHLRADAVSH